MIRRGCRWVLLRRRRVCRRRCCGGCWTEFSSGDDLRPPPPRHVRRVVGPHPRLLSPVVVDDVAVVVTRPAAYTGYYETAFDLDQRRRDDVDDGDDNAPVRWPMPPLHWYNARRWQCSAALLAVAVVVAASIVDDDDCYS